MDLVTWYQHVQTLPSGERTRLKARVRAVIVKTPRNALAWATLTPLAETDAQQYECITRARQLSPFDRSIRTLERYVNQLAFERMHALLHDQPSMVQSAAVPRIGDILRIRGMSTHAIHEALRLQRAAPVAPRRPLLGEILVRQQRVQPHDLAAALLVQSRYLLAANHSRTLLPIGLQLVLEGAISLVQLHQALLAQIEGLQYGPFEPLGFILVRRGDISETMLHNALDGQRERFYSQFS